MKANKMAFVVMMMTAAEVLMGCQPAVDPLPEPEVTYTVTYVANGFVGGTLPTDSSTYVEGSTVTTSSAMVGTDGWSLSQTGSTVATFAMPSANVTLYAQWKSPVDGKTFTNVADKTMTTLYQKNGATGSYFASFDDSLVAFDVSFDDCFTITAGGNMYLNNTMIGVTFTNTYHDSNDFVFITSGTTIEADFVGLSNEAFTVPGFDYLGSGSLHGVNWAPPYDYWTF